MPTDPFLAAAQAIDQAAEMALSRQRMSGHELKEDGSVVTEVDREVERFLRAELGPLTPGAGIWGEEYGFAEPTEAGYWVIDPIDGTSNFAFGLPLWGVTAGYLIHGKIEWGAMNLPALGWSFVARRGQGATLNGQPMRPIAPGPILDHQLVGYGDSIPTNVVGGKVIPGKVRHVGSFVVEAAFMAVQGLRAMLTSRCNLYDCAGGFAVLRELGAEVRHLDGTTWDEVEGCKPQRLPPLAAVPRGSNFPFPIE